MKIRTMLGVCALLAATFVPAAARADDDAATAGAAFSAGLAAAKEQRWGEALAAFERAAASKSHPLTTYNIGVAERALGQYTRARAHLGDALTQTDPAGTGLSTNYADQARAYLSEIDALLVHVDVTVDPKDASLAVDGRPLVAVKAGDDRVLYAGVAPSTPAAPVPIPRFEVIVDPGVHVFTLSKTGYDTVAPREVYKPGEHTHLELSLVAMSAKLGINAERAGAAVFIEDVDVGVVPVVIARPAGEYRIEVKKSGYVSYASKVTLRPGQRTDLFASMTEETPLTKKWWFWTGLGTLVVAAGITTFALLYDPSYDGGNRGWVAQPR